MKTYKKISVVGLGYIGLPTAAVFASRKIDVVGIDINPITVETINRGEVHIVEPDLDIAVRSAVAAGYLKASLEPEPAEAFIIAVPTPFIGEGHEPDLSYIESASKAIAPFLETGNIIILESTSPVGATEKMATWLAEARPDLTFPASHGEASDIRIAHCPERVLPGQIMRELIDNDRIIGGLTPICSAQAANLYKTFVRGECLTTNVRNAEMAKLVENSFRDVNIAFANELSIISDKLGIDVWELISLANCHPRVNILQPGPGVGGHCIAVDPWFIVSSAPEHAQLIRTAREVNDKKPNWVLEKIIEAAKNVAKSKVKIAIFGLAFKANIDDLRHSPAMQIAQHLADNHNYIIDIVEPNIDSLPECLDGVASLVSYEDAINRCDLFILLVDHDIFRTLDMSDHATKILDFRGIWNTYKGV